MARNSRLLTAEQARAIDRKTKEAFGISALVLMENAGRAVSQEAIKALGRRKSVAIFCGKGNNGGDGFVAGRHLLTMGIKPEIFLAGSTINVKKEARINLEILLKLKQRITEVKEENLDLVKRKITKCNLIIDALLGVGLSGQVSGIYRDLIGIMNNSGAYILSVDIPSGLDATSGRILGCCVRADKTVTFVAKKRGMIQARGPEYSGRVIVADLGIAL